MGCDIHIVIEREKAGAWREVPYQTVYRIPGDTPIKGIPEAPDVFTNRNYNLFAVLANVRNGRGFAGIQTGEGWPSIAEGRGLPLGFDPEKVAPHPKYPEEGPRSLGDHSFTWIGLEELKAFDWDGTLSWLYGVVPADVYEELASKNLRPHYSGGISGPGILTYEPDAYKTAKGAGTLCERPYVRMGWPTSAREATGDWPGKVIPWLEELAEGCPLRLVIGFDS